MRLLEGIIRTATRRPFYLAKYALEAVLFTLNHIRLRLFSGPNVFVGRNPHVIGFRSLQAERPGGSITVGDDFTSYYGCRISAWGEGRITIGDCCSIGSGTRVDCRESVEIGNHVLLAWDVLISDFDPHPLDPEERAIEMQYSVDSLWPRFSGGPTEAARNYTPSFRSRPIVIEDNVWVGARAIILKGVRVGQGAIIAAGAVVTKDVPPLSVAAGNPARVVRAVGATEDKG